MGEKSLKCHICSGLCWELTNILTNSFCTVQKGGSQNPTSIKSELPWYWTQHMVCALGDTWGAQGRKGEGESLITCGLHSFPLKEFAQTLLTRGCRQVRDPQTSSISLQPPTDAPSGWPSITAEWPQSGQAPHLCWRPQDLKIHGNY